jgi:hypothetical protein
LLQWDFGAKIKGVCPVFFFVHFFLKLSRKKSSFFVFFHLYEYAFFSTLPHIEEKMLLLKRLFCAVFAVFFTLNAWAEYEFSGSALCDGSQANNADLSIGFSVLPDDMNITGTFDYIPGSSSDIVVDFGMAYSGDEDAFSSVTLQDIQDYLIGDRPSYFAQNNAVVRCQFLNPGYEDIMWNLPVDVLVGLYGLDSPGGSMK